MKRKKYDLYFEFTSGLRFYSVFALKIMKPRYSIGVYREEKHGIKKDELTIFDRYIETKKSNHMRDISLAGIEVLGKKVENRKYELFLGEMEEKYKDYYSKENINIIFNYTGGNIKKNLSLEEVKESCKKLIKIDKKIIVYVMTLPDKYEELKKWQKELKTITDVNKKQELSNNIFKRELSLKNFDIKNNINELMSKELNERRNKYKELRQIQDSITGKIAHSCLMMKELKTLNEIKIIDKVTEIQNNYNKLLNQENEKLGRLEYNIESKKATKTFKRIFNNDSKLKEFIIPAFTQEEIKDVSQKLKSEIKEKLEENIKLRKLFANNSTTDEKLRIKIFDRNTNNLYSKQINVIKYYEEQIEKGISVPENTIMLNQKKSEVEKLEKNFKITSEDLQTEKQIVRSEQIEITSKIRTNNEKIDTLYKIIKELKIQRKRVNQIKINKNPESHKI